MVVVYKEPKLDPHVYIFLFIISFYSNLILIYLF